MKLYSIILVVAALAVVSCAPPVAVRVKGNYGTYSLNPDGVVIDIHNAK